MPAATPSAADRQQAIQLYDRFTHGAMDRRAFIEAMTKLAGSAAAAAAIIATIRADDAVAQTVPESRVQARDVRWNSADGRTLSGYYVRPLTRARISGAMLVVHENRGLNDHIRDVARRFAVAGIPALALDFLSPGGGTPKDEDAARTAIGKLDLAQSVRDGMDALAYLRVAENVPVGVVGFCWGGAMVDRLAVASGTTLAAGVSFYGSAPDPSEAPLVGAAMQFHLAGLDERVNKTAIPFAEALAAAGKTVDLNIYNGVNHAFHNDTSTERYNAEAAKLAWTRTLSFVRKAFLAGG